VNRPAPISTSRRGSLRLLTAGFGTLLVLMSALVFIGLFTLQRHQNQLDLVVSDRMTKVAYALEMRKAARERTLSLLRLLLTRDAFERDAEWMRFNSHGAEFARARTQLSAMRLSPREHLLLDQQGRLTAVAVPMQRRVVQLIEQDDLAAAGQLLANESIPAQNAVIAKVDEFDQLQRNAAFAAQLRATTRLSHARTLILVLGIGGLCIGLAIAITVTRVVRQRGDHDAYLATHDPLTGLPNRTLLMDRLQHALERCERHGGNLALLFIDIDRFKHINDSFGHAIGDQVLLVAAGRIAGQLRRSDTLARLSGDEFVALLDDAGDRSQVEVTAQRVVDICSAPVPAGEQQVPLSVSVGIALYPQHGRSCDELLSHGDTAMYVSKQAGRNRWQVYEGETMDPDTH